MLNREHEVLTLSSKIQTESRDFHLEKRQRDFFLCREARCGPSSASWVSPIPNATEIRSLREKNR